MGFLIRPSRREFFALAGAALLRGAPRSTRWALFSDTHVPEDPTGEYRGFKPYENLRAVVSEVLDASPAGALIDGDLARLKGLPGDYRNLAALLEPLTARMPVAMALGNHDNRGNFLAAFAHPAGRRQPVEGKFVTLIDAGPVRFLLLDSLIRTNYTPGLLGKKQRDWLDAFLRSAGPKPILVFLHHTLDDRDMSLLDVLWMFRILKPHRAVKAVVYGHSHAYKFDAEDGLHLINIPATGYNFNDSEPVGWVEAELTAAGAGFRLHAIGGNTSGDGKITSVEWRG